VHAQQEAVRTKQPGPLTPENLPLLLALAHPWLVKQIGQPILTAWAGSSSILRADIEHDIKQQGLCLSNTELNKKVTPMLGKDPLYLLHSIHGQRIWEAFCEVQAAIILMAEHGTALKWQSNGQEGTEQFQLEVLDKNGAAACFVQRFVYGAYTMDPDQNPDHKEAVKQQIKQG
jgi:hypothetical protein